MHIIYLFIFNTFNWLLSRGKESNTWHASRAVTNHIVTAWQNEQINKQGDGKIAPGRYLLVGLGPIFGLTNMFAEC